MTATLEHTAATVRGSGPTTGAAGSWRDRLVVPMPGDRLAGWVGTLLITLVGGLLRFWRLGSPRGDIFDEVYYHHDALSLLHHGVELNKEGNGAGFIVHPPLGKWAIAGGIKLFGDNEFGWRFMAAAAGTLSILVLARLARRMFRSTLLGCIAGLLLALDGLAFVQSRVALLDIFLMTFLVLAMACLVLDRDCGRARLARRLDGGAAVAWPGPRLGLRWWRLLAGVFLGCALATKWSALFSIPAYAALAFAWDVGARRSIGIGAPVRAALLRDWAGWVPGFLLLPVVVYTTSWAGWFAAKVTVSSGGPGGTPTYSSFAYDRRYAGRGGIVGSVKNWLQYQCEAYNFHKNLTDQAHFGGGSLLGFCHDAHTLHEATAHHPYESKPWSWLVLGKPVAFAYTAAPTGTQGCLKDHCPRREVLAIGTPAIWWFALIALVVVLGWWLATRDWRAAMILVLFSFGFFPWLLSETRVMFLFYALPLVPLMALAITMVLGLVLGRPDASPARRLIGGFSAGTYLLIVVINFGWLYPILANQSLSEGAWQARIWFPGWI